MALDLWKLKLICGWIILVLTFLPSILPFKLFNLPWGRWCGCCLRKKKKDGDSISQHEHSRDGEMIQKTVLGHMMCFGGGVFFGTYLLHMSIEVDYILSHTYIKDVTYPVSSLIMGIGFFLVLTTDQLVTSYRSSSMKKKKKLQRESKGAKGFSNPVFTTEDHIRDLKDVENGVAKRNGDTKVNGAIDQNLDHNNHLDNNNNNYLDLNNNHHSIQNDDDHHHSALDHHATHSHHHHQAYNDEDGHSEADLEELQQHQHATRSIVLVIALSLHHIFEGMSIGLQKHYDGVWMLTLAVLIHEVVICFSLGLQFYKSDKKLTKKVFIILFLAACILPLGVFIGIGISVAPNQDPSQSDLVNGVLQAIATGTFIYVSFFEILFEELGGHKATLSRVLATIMGFALMALLGLIPDGSETILVANSTHVEP